MTLLVSFYFRSPAFCIPQKEDVQTQQLKFLQTQKFFQTLDVKHSGDEGIICSQMKDQLLARLSGDVKALNNKRSSFIEEICFNSSFILLDNRSLGRAVLLFACSYFKLRFRFNGRK